MQDFHWTLLGLVVLAFLPAQLWGNRPSATEVANVWQVGRWRVPSLAAAMRAPGDNFLLIRLLAASVVIYGHSYAISGIPGAADHIARLGLGHGLYSGSIAVDVFFVVSGFLVTGAWLRRPELGFFLRSRALRILPAYVACMLLSAYALGSLFTTLPLREYLTNASTLDYVITNLKFDTELRWSLPGVFHDNPYPDTLNGSIWTLPAECRMYVWLALLGVLGLLNHRLRSSVALAGLAALAFSATPLPMLPIDDFVRLAGYFALGSLAWQWRERIPFHIAIVLALLVSCALVRQQAVFPQVFAATLTYSVLWFAYGPKSLLGFNRLGDYSYGVYLWGFPVQQAVAHMLASPTPTRITLCSLPVALMLGVASWHLLEKPLLRFKQVRITRHARVSEHTTTVHSAPVPETSGEQ